MTLPTNHAPRRLPIGAELLAGGGASFRVWAPKRREVAAVVTLADGRRAELPLAREGNGYFSTIAADAANVAAGAQYGFRLDRGERVYADPASRFQPKGTDGLSEVVDPRAFAWTDQQWQGVKPPGQVIYELHVGTFTPEGTWEAAIAQLPELARAGMTLIEVMPLAEFPGKFGWGYDG
ncbi:MAG: malto-oligosyltrehalose trehalohydrolase, partial [Planctomycetia bacterium]|nr:malto-oligosyltrehalose trehalohydrolase [Planctomycetia bacterium]